MKTIFALAAALLLCGCEAASYYSDAGIRAAKAAKDTEAKVLLQTPCAVGGGAYVRLPDVKQKMIHSYWVLMCPD